MWEHAHHQKEAVNNFTNIAYFSYCKLEKKNEKAQTKASHNNKTVTRFKCATAHYISDG